MGLSSLLPSSPGVARSSISMRQPTSLAGCPGEGRCSGYERQNDEPPPSGRVGRRTWRRCASGWNDYLRRSPRGDRQAHRRAPSRPRLSGPLEDADGRNPRGDGAARGRRFLMARNDPVSGTAISVRLPQKIATEIALIARIEGVSVSEVI